MTYVFFLLLLPTFLFAAGQIAPYYVTLPTLLITLAIASKLKIKFVQKLINFNIDNLLKDFLIINIALTILIFLSIEFFSTLIKINDFILIFIPIIYTFIELVYYIFISKIKLSSFLKNYIYLLFINIISIIIIIGISLIVIVILMRFII